MPVEGRLVILAQSVLTSTISTTQTNFSVASAADFPAPPFRLYVDNETMAVTAVSGSTLTVQRGAEMGIATKHFAGAAAIVPAAGGSGSSVGVPGGGQAPLGQVPYADGGGRFRFDSTLNFATPAPLFAGPDLLGIGHASFGSQARLNNPSPIPFLNTETFTAIIMLADAVNGAPGSPPTTIATGIANHIDYAMARDATYPYHAYEGRVITRANNTFYQGSSIDCAFFQYLNFAIGNTGTVNGVHVEMGQNTNNAGNVIAEMNGIDISVIGGNNGTVTTARGINIETSGVTTPGVLTNYTGIQVGTFVGIGASTNVTGLSLSSYYPSATQVTGKTLACSAGGTWDLSPGPLYDVPILHLRRPTATTGIITTQKMVEMTNNLNQVVAGFQYDWQFMPVHRTDAQTVGNEGIWFSSTQNYLAYRDSAGVIHGLTTTNVSDPVAGGIVGCVLFVGAGGLLSQNPTNLFWDDTLFALGVGTNTLSASAKLQIDSGTQGLLPPRMTTAQRDAIATPATGLQIFNTTTNAINYWDSSAWVAPSTGIGGTVTGGTTGSVLFVGAAAALAQNNANFFWNDATGSLGIGTNAINAAAKLQLDSTTQGLLPPRLTTVQQNAVGTPPAGLALFNSTSRTANVYNGFNWVALQGSLFDHFL